MLAAKNLLFFIFLTGYKIFLNMDVKEQTINFKEPKYYLT